MPTHGRSDATVSRHRMLLESPPPEVRVRDLCSRNGTLANDKKIGARGESVESRTRTMVLKREAESAR